MNTVKQNTQVFPVKFLLFFMLILGSCSDRIIQDMGPSNPLEKLTSDNENHLLSDNKPTLQQTIEQQNDVPLASLAGNDMVSVLTSMPYYCDPTRYGPNIIQNIKACEPYLGLYPTSYGSSAAPIGYRIRYDLLNRHWRHDDDDDHRGRGSWRNRSKRHRHNGSRHYQGSTH